jgi:hypothetical protein
MLEMEKANKRKPDLWVLRLSDIEVYESSWGTIMSGLQRSGGLGMVSRESG